MRHLLCLSFLLAAVPVMAADSPIGRQVEPFSLDDFRGKTHALADLKDQKAVVVVFLGTECPLAKLYGPRLAELSKKYAEKGVAFLGINANSQDSITEIAAYARVHEIEFPILKDVGNKVADAFAAKRTPEAFLLDADRKIRYHGRIDDQYGIGTVRHEPTRKDLALAIDEMLAGKRPAVEETKPVGCHIGRVRAPKPNSPVTYSNQIARILQDHCVECHREGEIAPFALTEYSEVAGWAEMIDEVVREQRMPPWHADPKYGHFADNPRLSDDEKRLIHEWVVNGAPEGDSKDLPKPREFVTGWNLPKEPDAIVPMRDKPFTVPAEGEVKYQYFVANPKFTEDKWFTAAEVVPGNRAVVHHILVMTRLPGGRLLTGTGEGGGFLAAYVPGLRATPLPAGMAKRIPAGSQLIFQIHYTPIGSKQEDLSRIAFVFADPKTITHEVRTLSSANRGIQIPPGAANHEEQGRPRPLPENSQLLSLSPHMHLRGKSFRYEAVLPDGRTEILLDVPHYDFNWQTRYRLEKPLSFPKGTTIRSVAHFDNSPENLHNPDPKQTVRWGDQTWEEMLLGYFDIATPYDPDAPADKRTTRAQQILDQYDSDGDGVIRRDEVPERIRPIFDRLDVKKDGELTLEDLKEVVEFLPAN